MRSKELKPKQVKPTEATTPKESAEPSKVTASSEPTKQANANEQKTPAPQGGTQPKADATPEAPPNHPEGEPFEGQGGRWFVVKNGHVQPAPNPNKPQESPKDASGTEEQPEAGENKENASESDPEAKEGGAKDDFAAEWDQEISKHVDDIEKQNTADHTYSPEEKQAEEGWHEELVDAAKDSQGKLKPEDAPKASRFLGGLLNPVIGTSDYVSSLIGKAGIPETPTELSTELETHLDGMNPGGKGGVNQLVSILVAGLFGDNILKVAKSMGGKTHSDVAGEEASAAAKASKGKEQGEKETARAKEKQAKENKEIGKGAADSYLKNLHPDDLDDLHADYLKATGKDATQDKQGFRKWVEEQLAKDAESIDVSDEELKHQIGSVQAARAEKDPDFKAKKVRQIKQQKTTSKRLRTAAANRKAKLETMTPEDRAAYDEEKKAKQKKREEGQEKKAEGFRKQAAKKQESEMKTNLSPENWDEYQRSSDKDKQRLRDRYEHNQKEGNPNKPISLKAERGDKHETKGEEKARLRQEKKATAAAEKQKESEGRKIEGEHKKAASKVEKRRDQTHKTIDRQKGKLQRQLDTMTPEKQEKDPQKVERLKQDLAALDADKKKADETAKGLLDRLSRRKASQPPLVLPSPMKSMFRWMDKSINTHVSEVYQQHERDLNEMEEATLGQKAMSWLSGGSGAELVPPPKWMGPKPKKVKSSPFRHRTKELDSVGIKDSELRQVGEWASSNGFLDGRGQIFVNPETSSVWFVSCDSSTYEFCEQVEKRLRLVSGVMDVRIESEAQPPENAGWKQVFPNVKPLVGSKRLNGNLMNLQDAINAHSVEEVEGINVWLNTNIPNRVIIDVLDWGSERIGCKIGKIAEQSLNNESKVEYRNEGAKPQASEGWVRVRKTNGTKNLAWQTKGEGESCKLGETAASTGCIPASGDGERKETSAKDKKIAGLKEDIEKQVSRIERTKNDVAMSDFLKKYNIEKATEFIKWCEKELKKLQKGDKLETKKAEVASEPDKGFDEWKIKLNKGESKQPKEADELLKDTYEWERKLTPKEKNSVNWYTGGEYITMNKSLRECPQSMDCLSAELKRKKQEIDDALKKFPKRKTPVEVVRKLSLGPGSLNAYLQGLEQAKQKGLSYHLPGFQSTTVQSDPSFPGNVELRIKAKSGAYVDSVSEMKGEFEWLMPHGLPFKIGKIVKSGKNYSVELEEIG